MSTVLKSLMAQSSSQKVSLSICHFDLDENCYADTVSHAGDDDNVKVETAGSRI